MEYLSSAEVAKLLKVSIDKVKILEKLGILHTTKREGQKKFYSSEEIARIKPHRELTITELATISGIEIQNKTISFVVLVRKILILMGSLISGYLLLIVIFVVLFIISPLQTAYWLGIVKTKIPTALTQENNNEQILGAMTSVIQANNISPIQTILQPVGKVSLDLVKNISPGSYLQVSKVAILDTNDVLALDSSNAMMPVVPLKVSNNSLEVTSPELISNLNSQYVQGKKPGTSVGDIAVIGNNGRIEGLSVPINGAQQGITLDIGTITGLTNTNLSGSAGITNTNLANSAVTITTTNPLSGGGTVSLGGSLSLTCPGCNSIVDLTSKVTSVLPLENGGTGATSFTTNGILYGDGASVIKALIPGTSGYILQSNGTGSPPSWVTASNLSAGTVPFSGITTGTNTNAIMTIGTGGTLQYSGTGVLNANQLLGSTWTVPGTIGSTIANTGTFTTLTDTTINGLTITNNGANTLNIAIGKTLTASNSLTFTGTDGTSFTFPVSSDDVVGRTAAQTLINKTLAAGSNTISELTNSNLSGSAGITNGNLANSSLTVTAGTGLLGGGIVSLGSAVTLNNAGVLSLTSTQATVSAATGNITISLPQNIDTSANPFFSSLRLSNTSNQLVMGNTGILNWAPTTSRTLTLPDVTDTLVGKTTTDVLTNKTVTAPIINGTVTTTGLTLPAFTASGNITGSGSPTISSFGTINGLIFASVSDGFTVVGGTTSRTLTVTGADITIGNTIKPSSSGGLTVQSNGTNTLTLDTGGASTVNLGTTNATTLSLGNSSAVASITGNKWSVASSGAETLSPISSSTTALTVNGTTNTTPADAVDINLLHTGGIATNGLVVNMNGSGGTTTNGVNVTQSIGTLSNGISLSGTIANALNFVGTSFTKLINSSNFIVTNGGVVTGGTYNGITISSTIQPSASGTISLESNGANTVTLDTGSAGSTINLGNTNAEAIALGNGTQNTTLTLTGTGLTTLGGNLTFSGSAVRTITGPNTGAAGALTLTTTGNISGLTLETAHAVSGNSGSISLITGTVTTTGTSGNVSINTGSSNTATVNTGGITIQSGNITTSGISGDVALEVGTGGTMGTIQLGVATAAPISIGTSTMAAKTITIGETANAATQINLNSGSGFIINGSTGVYSVKGGATADITTIVSSAGTGLTILPSAPSATNPGTVLTLKGGAATTTGNGGGVIITGGLGVGTSGNGGGLTFSGGAAGTSTATGGTIIISTGAGGTVSGASGSLTIQTGTTTSGNSGAITIDTGVGTGGTNGIISMGTTNASALTIGRSGVTTAINGLAAANNLTIGGGTTILKHISGTNTFQSPGIGQSSCSNIGTVTVAGATVGNSVTASPTAVSGGIETTLLSWNAYVSSANTVTIRACSVGGLLSNQTPANQTWRVDVWQH